MERPREPVRTLRAPNTPRTQKLLRFLCCFFSLESCFPPSTHTDSHLGHGAGCGGRRGPWASSTGTACGGAFGWASPRNPPVGRGAARGRRASSRGLQTGAPAPTRRLEPVVPQTCPAETSPRPQPQPPKPRRPLLPRGPQSPAASLRHAPDAARPWEGPPDAGPHCAVPPERSRLPHRAAARWSVAGREVLT